MVSRKMILGVFIFVSIIHDVQSQQNADLDLLAGRFIKYVRSDNKEKIIVLTDKEFYTAGETIWLKAWCLDSLSNHFIRKSKNLYVDLVDDSDRVINQLLFNVESEETSGKIILPQSLREGCYWLRAFTANILKEDSGRIFVKPIYVVNPSKPDSTSFASSVPESTANTPDTVEPKLIFFPEGGEIIGGTTASIAFRCVDSHGQPLNISGYITDTRNDTVSRFRASLPGIGKFKFDAFNPRKYFAHIQWNTKEIIYPLPHLNQYGSQLSFVSQTEQLLRIRVNQGDSLYKKNRKTFILGISRDSLCFAAYGTDMYEVVVPKKNFPKGKATFFLFNDQMQIVSQRNIYIESSINHVVVNTNKTVYGAREKVKLDLAVSTEDNSPSLSLFSVAVTTDEFADPNQQSVFFADNAGDKYSSEDIDAMMITEKKLYPAWKFDENTIFKISNFNNGDSSLLNIKGRIVNKNNLPMKKTIINLFSQDKSIFKIDTVADDGRFQITMPDYDDSTRFDVKLTNFKGQGEEGKIILDRFQFPQFPTPKQSKKPFIQSEIAVIKKYKDKQIEDSSFTGTDKNLLKAVKITAPKKAPPNYDVSKRVSTFSDIITSDKLNKGDRYGIINSIASIGGFNTGPTSMHISTTKVNGVDEPTVLSEGGQPLLVMDGTIMNLKSESVSSFLLHFEQSSIDFIEVLKGPQTAIYGIQGANGVILINTNKINRKKAVIEISSSGISTIYLNGYFKHPELKVPDYDIPEIKKSPYPDLRCTIYWKDNILTDKDGKATLYFFTADVKTSYNVLVRGIDENGDIFFKSINIQRR